MVVRMNFGCGSVQPEGWVNVDKQMHRDAIDYTDFPADLAPEPGLYRIDARHWEDWIDGEYNGGGPGGLPTSWSDSFDYIVANHSLSDLTHHELPYVLRELYRVLKPGGVLRVLVPDFERAMEAWENDDGYWFPQGDDLTSVAERFCTFVTWFGTVGSVFTNDYLIMLLRRAGFTPWGPLPRGATHMLFDGPEICSLDGDRTTALIMEGRKP